MKSRISLFDKAVYRKNLTRFAPAWVLYCVALLMLLAILMDAANSAVGFASDLSRTIGFFGLFNFFYALLCAQLLFGDLFNSRMCNALHAMPIRRETWFVTNVASGLSFALVPYLGFGLITMLFVENLITVPLLWLLAVSLQYVFFFGTAVLSCYCVGNRFAMALIYLILNGFSIIVYWLVDTLYQPLLYGIELDMQWFELLCPVGQMIAQYNYVDVYYSKLDGHIVDGPTVLLDGGWWYLAVCAAVGLACMGIGLMLYRRRQLESAGDFMAVRALNPVFLILYTLCGGAVCHAFFSLFIGENNLTFVVVGMTVGVFTGLMLLERTVKVFRKKNWLCYGAVLLAFGLSVALTALDPLGITRWVPKESQVASVSFYTGGSRNLDGYEITDPEQLQALLDIHRHGVEHWYDGENGKVDVRLYLTYTMKNGLRRSRNYYIDVDTEAGQSLKKLMSTPEQVLGILETELETYLKTLDTIMVDASQFADKFPETELAEIARGKSLELQGEQMRQLMQAVLLDCKEGTMAQDWNFHDDQPCVWITLCRLPEGLTGRHYYQELRVYESCTHTWQWLEDYLESLIQEI